MKQRILYSIITAISILVIGTITFAKTITIASGEWGPWAGKKIPNHGFVCHVIKEVFSLKGYDVTFRFFPWERAYRALIAGTVDCSAYWYPSKKRKKMCLYSDVLTYEKIVFFYIKTNPMQDWDKIEDLKIYKIGINKGNTYTDRFLALGKNGILHFDEVYDDILNFRKLIAGRVDIVPASLVMGLETIRNEFSHGFAQQIVYHPKPLSETTGHLLFKREREGSQKLLRLFNEGLKEIRKNGLYDKFAGDLLSGKYYSESK